MYSGWVEANSCAKANVATIAKCLLMECLPRFGIPICLGSDKGTHFANQVIKKIARLFNYTKSSIVLSIWNCLAMLKELIQRLKIK